ncbi:LysE family translocator [Gynuella sunshinyii]|uniref:Putative threonine efflux protein n=1 Tax=Gynuella sunshinyii YC6258 TaxID=1445510 RepID=A0A0C5V8Q1_9GAMM|nr:LysE family translocator [Gynuella sunshinyii]AJQ95735.1 putative threonine efflux protein [Gynuella sunshinyii YC6258]
MSIEFFLTSLIVVLLPGTGVIYTLATGLGQGAKASIIAAFGCTLGIVPHVFASIVGLAAILHASSQVFEVIKMLGVLYLFYMAWNVLRDGGMMTVTEERTKHSTLKIIRNAILLNFLNPKLSLFFLAFLPQFIPADTANPTPMLVVLALIFMLLTFIVFIGYGLCASMARDMVISRPNVMRWFRRTFAGAFALLGLRLALGE